MPEDTQQVEREKTIEEQRRSESSSVRKDLKEKPETGDAETTETDKPGGERGQASSTSQNS